jgi:hypothetical protein
LGVIECINLEPTPIPFNYIAHLIFCTSRFDSIGICANHKFLLNLCRSMSEHLLGTSLLCVQLLDLAWATLNDKLILHLWNHLNHPQLKILFLKGMTFFYVIFTTFNLCCVSFIEYLIVCIFFSY